MSDAQSGESSTTATDGVAAVDRALSIALALARAAAPMQLSELSRATGLYKSTLLRLLASLERANLVTRRTDRRYTLGPLAFLFGRAFDASNGLREGLTPILDWLVAHGTESPSFHIQHGPEQRLCLLRLDSAHSTLDRVRVGDILPLHRGAAGKVLLAFREDPPTVDSTLIFTSFGERDPLCGAVACPVFGPFGMLLGALSLSGPLERFSPAAVERMSTLLLQAGERATHALGGNWPRHPPAPGA
ncbi:IclR family transcriptional regulator [Cupriavidus sp. AU9028]|uniref:IclR family transcriptional regulator n=1 Tax=Cupriavidus sp. AU9028 TaxID=2871157 RepID=UPI001C95A825|nr:helix-turn-helix domain-containing protein [Cupriavidus sp. AU9028]MBY4897030.1 helix-turn-helix domain-containing protein [Cupriavidus sp. AU9028]